MSEPLTGTQYEIAAGDYAAVVTESGAGLRTLTHRGRELIAGYDADRPAPAGRGQLLLPWPNRIDRGRYTVDGAEEQLDITEPSHDVAIHGLTRWAPWQPSEHTAERITLTHRLHAHPGYPYRLDLAVRYVLDAEAGLAVTVTARNVGSRAAPFGAGTHPYLTTGAASVDACTLTMGADQWVPTDARGIPTALEDVTGTDRDFRGGAPLRGVSIDHAFTGLHRDADGRAWARLTSPSGGVALWADETHPWFEVFTGDTLPPGQARVAIAVEPMTCPPNAFVTGVDVITLAPGDERTFRWGIMHDDPTDGGIQR